MGKTIKKILCTMLIVVMCLTSAPLVSFDFKAEATDYKVGDIIQFGSYPQSKVTDDDIISALNSKAPTWDEWTSYGYYSGTGDIGTMKPGDWMRYTDVTYNGIKYRGVKFIEYRPNYTYFPLGDEAYREQLVNGYYVDRIYWFKFEQINWRVLDLNTGLIMSENIIDSQAYSNTIYSDDSSYFNDLSYINYASEYKTSSIRKWLNNDFYDIAFTDSEKKEINLSEKLDIYDTKDKVFLLSQYEIGNNKYGFDSDWQEYDIARRTQGSDYAKSQGLNVCMYSGTYTYYNGNSDYWLRVETSYGSRVQAVDEKGFANLYASPAFNDMGVRPALCLNRIAGVVNSETPNNPNSSSDPNNPNNPDDPNKPNNPTEPDKPNEEPRDFSDYEVESGKLEEVIYGVDSNGNECITEVIINGKKYNIERDYEVSGLSDSEIEYKLDKEVAFAVLDDEIVMVEPLESISDYCLAAYIKDDIGLYCGYGYMYSEQDDKGAKYIPGDFTSNKNLNLSIYSVPDENRLIVRGNDYDEELLEYMVSQLPDAQLHIDKIQLKLRNTNAISFDGKDTYTINVNADIKSNQTLNHFIPIVVRDEYEIPEDKRVELVLFDIVITGERNGEKVEFTNTENIKIRNCDYVEPVKDKNNNKPTKRQYAKDAAARLDGLTGAITLTGLLGLFSSEELDYIGNVILAEIAMAEAPKDTLEQYLSTKVIDGLFSIDSNFIKFSSEDEIEFTVAGDTKYGEIKLKLICKYSKAYLSGNEFCFTGSVDYEVIGGKGANKLPSSYKNGGLAGMFSSVDMQSFCESAYKLFECHLQKGVDEVWGNDVDGAADLIFGTIVNEILAETELESVSNIAFEIMAKPGKSVLINCPVDVYVYNADDELVAAVVGNEVIQTDEKAQISVDGDVKKVVLLDDSYSIIYRAIADGEMKITVEEYGTSGGLLNSSTISEIPLIAGRKYTQSIDNNFMEESEYTVTSASGNDYVPDKGYSTLAGHDYISGIIKEATCQENGKLINTCSKCGDTYTETIPATGHTFDGSECINCDYDKADECDCRCHSTGIRKFFFNFILFFQKLFKKNAVCDCGVAHY